MIVLGIDTSGAGSSAAMLGPHGAVMATADVPRGHARVLPGLIESVAEQSAVALADVTHVAVARGPGLFTGMRVGLVTAQMVALARGLPVAGVSTLDALARRVVARTGGGAPFAVLIDARRREVFAQAFDGAGQPVDEPRATAASAVVVPGTWDVYVDAALSLPGVPLHTEGLALEVAELAMQRWQQGVAQDPATPLYLRRPDTTAANPARSVLGRP